MNGVILTLILSTLCAFQVSNNSTEDYFPLEQDAWTYYESLGTDQRGINFKTSVHCITSSKLGSTTGTVEEIGIHGTTSKLIYKVFNEGVQLWYSKKKSAPESDPISPPHFILKLPLKDEVISWTWNSLYYRAEYKSNIKTKSGTYDDCILVTQGDGNHVNLLNKKYYAKGVGLVLVENINTEGILDSLTSFELVKPK